MMARIQAKSERAPSFTLVRPNLLQRKCACGGTLGLAGECAECRRKRLQLREAGHSRPTRVPPIVHEVLHSAGRPLDPDIRAFMEPRFGHDFSRVRVHTDARAAESARAVGALAYTVGRHVVFGSGQPGTGKSEGTRLLAHELTHIVQQERSYRPVTEQRTLDVAPGDGPSEREAETISRRVVSGRGNPTITPAVQPGIQRQAAGVPGSSRYADTFATSTHSSASPGVWSGTVRREEFGPGNMLIHSGVAPVRYDENSCSVTVPMTVAFRQATLNDVNMCPPELGRPAPTSLPAPLSNSAFRDVADGYIRTINERLNGWYSVRMEGCPENRCHGQNMPIRVQVSEVAPGASPEYEVAVVNLAGRSCVAPNSSGIGGTVLLYAQGIESGTLAHEGGHMILGHGDEYRETEPGVTRPVERVREEDWSLLASHPSFGRYALLHERHFGFVPAFLNGVRPGCNARLVEQSRALQLDVTPTFGAGYASFARPGAPRSAYMYLDLGVGFGVPLNRLREWELILGAHGRMLSELNTPNRRALMLGVRVGLEGTLTPSAGGITFGAFGEAGEASISAGGSSPRASGYAEGGASLGYSPAPSGGVRGLFGLEGAAGSELGAPSDPEALRWFRIGVSLGLRF